MRNDDDRQQPAARVRHGYVTASPGRILDAASTLLRAGGPDAVTIADVTRRANVARATLYRHFESRDDLLAAAFQRLLPALESPPADGPLRDRLISVVLAQAATLVDAPITVSAVAWLALSGEFESGPSGDAATLRQDIITRHLAPLRAIFEDPATIAKLGVVDPTTALCLLIGPIMFARIAHLTDVDYRECGVTAVDAFLEAHRRPKVRRRRAS